MQILLTVIFSLGGGIAAGISAGMLLLLIAPCSWFGSSFEGACGYGAAYSAIGLGLVVAAGVGLILAIWLTKRLARPTIETSPPNAQPRTKLDYALWTFLAVGFFGQALLTTALGTGIIMEIAAVFLLIVELVLAAAVAVHRGKHPAVAALLFVPLLGPALVVVAIYRKPAQSALATTER